MKFTFRRAERLRSRKTIARMFKEGKSVRAYPLRLVWLPLAADEAETPVQFGVSVPKRNFKSAVARNRLKRRLKEAWRLNKGWLYRQLEGKQKSFAFMVLYTGKEELAYPEIEAALQKLNRAFLSKEFPNERKKMPGPANPKTG